MQTEIKEVYATDKEELSVLVQEWIDENILNICWKPSKVREPEYKQKE